MTIQHRVQILKMEGGLDVSSARGSKISGVCVRHDKLGLV
jgi:hypothetical protein